jgi:hypothetical protein
MDVVGPGVQEIGTALVVVLLYALGAALFYAVIRAAVTHGVLDALDRRDARKRLADAEAALREPARP